MNDKSINKIKKRVRFWIILFITGLVLSGITAFPVEAQLSILVKYLS